MRKFKVIIVQRIVPSYRVSLFKAMGRILSGRGIALEIWHGNERFGESPRGVGVGAIEGVHERYIDNIYIGPVVLQPGGWRAGSGDVVILEQANRFPLNYLIMLGRLFRHPRKFAWWGHGYNHQAEGSRINELFKGKLRNLSDHFFYYCPLKHINIDGNRSTILMNTIDTEELRRELLTVRRQGVSREEFQVCFIGSMRYDKELPFLFESLEAVKDKVPDLKVVFCGTGPLAGVVGDWCQVNSSWARYIGHVEGLQKAEVLARSDVITIPGLIGLVVIDAMVAGVPLVTTDYNGKHSPEISYITDGKNGLITPMEVHVYANAIAELLLDRHMLESMRSACYQESCRYNISAMAARFCSGIVRMLAG